MKYQVIAALLGAVSSVQLTEQMKGKNTVSEDMRKKCADVMNIAAPDTNLLELGQDDEATTTPATANEAAAETTPAITPTQWKDVDESDKGLQKQGKTNADGTEQWTNKYIKGNYGSHYGKSVKAVDAENKHILDTQAKCLDFVEKYKGHRAVCNWCKASEEPEILWKWNPTEDVWYRHYDGDWHYWGPSKDGFTTDGWTWHDGYWHHDGYAFKYEGGKWYRFQDREWAEYDHSVPVKPEKPEGKEICRPYYHLEKKGFPESMTTSQVPRCQVGEDIYMWEDEANCKFLGGKMVMVDHQVCVSGESHKWKKVVKCVKGQVLSSEGLDYKTGQLNKDLYNFQQCELVNDGKAGYVVLFGQCHQIPDGDTLQAIWGKTAQSNYTKITEKQMGSCPKGKPLQSGAHLATVNDESFLINYSQYMQIDGEQAFSKCKFDKTQAKKVTLESLEKMLPGDIITA